MAIEAVLEQIHIRAYDPWAAIKAGPKQINLPLDARSAAGELAETATSEPQNVRYDQAPDVGGHWVRPAAGKPDCTIVYLFGGGYVLGSPVVCCGYRTSKEAPPSPMMIKWLNSKSEGNA